MRAILGTSIASYHRPEGTFCQRWKFVSLLILELPYIQLRPAIQSAIRNQDWEGWPFLSDLAQSNALENQLQAQLNGAVAARTEHGVTCCLIRRSAPAAKDTGLRWVRFIANAKAA